MADYRKEGTFERPISTFNGIAMLLLAILLIAGIGVGFGALRNPLIGVSCAIATAFILPGFFMLQPNQAAVVTLFGPYLGTERTSGLRATLPWNERTRGSVRARDHNVENLQVHD